MNYEKRFLKIKSFLKKHDYLVDQEMLTRFESKIPAPYDQWIQHLSTFSVDDLLTIENTYCTKKMNCDGLLDFIEEVKSLIDFDFYEGSTELISGELTRKMSEKKRHEISQIKAFLKDQDLNHFVDIGSGAGHLSSALVDDKRTSICMDENQAYQLIGSRKIARWAPQLEDKIQFVHKKIQTISDIIMPDEQGMLLGLHCCGPLSTTLVKAKPTHLLNLGCCYHKLVDEYNISQLAQDHPLVLSNHALTCAAKGSTWQTQKSFRNKQRVKRYRYALHFLLLESFDQSFTTLGNAKTSDYKGSFSTYCLKFAPQTSSLTTEEIEAFYAEILPKIDLIISAGSLRALLARVIEAYLIVDRVLYLRENGKSAKIIQIFDKKISPRNMAIYF